MKHTQVLITPYVGVNGYKFGKTPAEIAAVFGPPTKTQEDEIMEMIIEEREHMEFEYHRKGRKHSLSSITIFKKHHDDVMVNGMNIFEKMKENPSNLDPGFLEGEKYFFYGKLGISIAGYSRKKPKEGPYAIAFNKASHDIFELDGLKK